MNTRRLLRDATDLKALAERLSRCPEVARLDEGKDREAWTLAHAFADLEESFRKFLEDQLPRLTQDQLEVSEVHDLLLEIGEELRHILYHIKDPKFYRYLHHGGRRRDGRKSGERGSARQ
jgi:hypothetical protein